MIVAAVQISCFHTFHPLSERQLLVTQLWNVPVGFSSSPLPLNSEQVQRRFDFYTFGVPGIDIYLNTKWFHISASWVIERGACRYPTLSNEYDSQSKLVLFDVHVHPSCLIRCSFISKVCRICIFGDFLLWLNNTWNNMHYSLSITHTFLSLLQSVQRPLLPLVTGKDVDVEALVEGFESSFIGGASDKKPVT